MSGPHSDSGGDRVNGTSPRSAAAAASLAVGVAAAIGFYLWLSNWLTVHAADKPWAVAALLGPLWCAGAVAALKQRHKLGMAALLAIAVMVGLVVALGGAGDVSRLYVMQHVGIHLALCLTFAITLRGRVGGDSANSAGRLSLIGRVAARVHGSLTPAMADYAWRITAAWAIYFIGMACLSVLVYLFASWTAWSLLANVVTPILIVAIFVGEYVLRYRLHPEFERATLMDAVRAYRGIDSRKPA